MQNSALDHSSTLRRAAAVLWGGCLCILLAGGCAKNDIRVEGVEDALKEAKLSIRVSDFAAAYELLAKHAPLEGEAEDVQAEWYFLSGISAWHRVPPSAEWQEYAKKHLEELVEKFPASPLAAQAAYTMGRILEVRDFPKSPA